MGLAYVVAGLALIGAIVFGAGAVIAIVWSIGAMLVRELYAKWGTWSNDDEEDL